MTKGYQDNLPSEGSRTTLIVVGLILAFIANFTGWWLLWIIGITLVLIGCYQWTRLKNRHWAFMFWGLLAPIGLLGISLLQDKSGEWTSTLDQSGDYPATPSARDHDSLNR